MFKRFILVFLLLVLSGLSFTKNVYGQGTEVNSFELFWPIAAGKTVEDPIFFLKNLKEKVRGFLVFSPVKKANYAVFIGTKRVLEAEKLINEGKKDSAEKTFKLASSQFDKAQKNIDATLAVGGSFGEARSEMTKRLNNLETLLKWLIEKDTLGLKSGLEEVLSKVMLATSKL